MKRIIRQLAPSLAAFVLAASAAGADGYGRAGTAAAPELLIPVGARDMALGGAAIATTSGIEALHWNPAGLARSGTDAGLLVSTMSYIADIRLNYAAAAARFGRLGSFAVSLKSLDLGSIPITTESQPDGTGGKYSPTFFVLGATYARQLNARTRLGVTANYVSNRFDRVSATGTSFNAGLQYANLGDIDGLHLGVALKHIGAGMRYEGQGLLRRGQLDGLRRSSTFYMVQPSTADLPTTFEIGLAYDYPLAGAGRLGINSLFQHHGFNYDQYRVGVEYEYDDFLALRSGFDYAADAGDDTYLFGSSFGFGVRFSVGDLKEARLDYAYTSVDHFDGLNTFTLQVGL